MDCGSETQLQVAENLNFLAQCCRGEGLTACYILSFVCLHSQVSQACCNLVNDTILNDFIHAFLITRKKLMMIKKIQKAQIYLIVPCYFYLKITSNTSHVFFLKCTLISRYISSCCSKGYYVEPTILEAKNPQDRLMAEVRKNN